jgi:hypothetical protein
MMFFPGGKVRDVYESFLSVPEKRASLAAEQENAARARDQLVASRLAPERIAIRMSEIELRDVETCDTKATSDTGDVMGGCPTIRKQTVPSAISRPQGSGPSNFGYWTSVGSVIIWRGTTADMSADV